MLHSAIMCLRGARSHQGCPLFLGAFDLALAEGEVASTHWIVSHLDFSICLARDISVLGVVARGAGNTRKKNIRSDAEYVGSSVSEYIKN